MDKPFFETTIKWKRTSEALPGLYPDKNVLFYGPKFGVAHGRYEQGVFYVNGSSIHISLEFVTWWAYEPEHPEEAVDAWEVLIDCGRGWEVECITEDEAEAKRFLEFSTKDAPQWPHKLRHCCIFRDK